MGGAHEVAEHIEHEAHGGHEAHGHTPEHKKLGTLIGLTMAMLGVVLAFAAAKVGGERTELVKALVDQQNAHAKYQGQDIKHRMAALNLEQEHALLPPPGAPAEAGPAKSDVILMANTVSRYLTESRLAKEWVEAYDPLIEAHIEGQEHFELGQLLAEIGIVIASIALLMHRKSAWFVSIALGVGAIGMVAFTYVQTHSAVKTAEAKIEHTGKEYREARNADKTTAQEDALVKDMLQWAGAPAPAPAETHHE